MLGDNQPRSSQAGARCGRKAGGGGGVGATLRAWRCAAVSFLTGQTGEEAVLGQLHSLAVGVGAGARGGAPRHLDL